MLDTKTLNETKFFSKNRFQGFFPLLHEKLSRFLDYWQHRRLFCVLQEYFKAPFILFVTNVGTIFGNYIKKNEIVSKVNYVFQ